jgi:hypothetical protein
MAVGYYQSDYQYTEKLLAVGCWVLAYFDRDVIFALHIDLDHRSRSCKLQAASYRPGQFGRMLCL